MPGIVLDALPWGLLGLVLAAFLYVLLFKPENAYVWGGWLLAIGQYLSRTLRQRRLAGRVQHRINSYRQEMAQLAPSALPYNVEVQFVTEVERDAFLGDDDNVIVKASFDDNLEKTVANIAYQYCQRGLLPKTRSYIEPHLAKSLDLTVTKSMLKGSGTVGIEWFVSHLYAPEIQASEAIARFCDIFDNLNKRGHFSRVALVELTRFGEALFPDAPAIEHFTEAKEFVDFLALFAFREPGDRHQTCFRGNNIKTAIMLVASPQKIETAGVEPYLEYVRIARQRGTRWLYLTALGLENIVNASFIAEVAQSERYGKIVHDERYEVAGLTGFPLRGICIQMQLGW